MTDRPLRETLLTAQREGREIVLRDERGNLVTALVVDLQGEELHLLVRGSVERRTHLLGRIAGVALLGVAPAEALRRVAIARAERT